MKKIVFLEDKITRVSYKKCTSEYLTNILDKECNDFLGKFENDKSILDDYDVIIIHSGIYLDEKRDIFFQMLEEYCIDKSKNLVKFSGDGDPSYIDDILTLTAVKLYENIEMYLSENEQNKSNILMLAYGKNWDLNPLSNTLEKLNIFIENHQEDDEIDFDEFEDDFALLELKKILNDDYSLLFKDMVDFKNEISIEQIKTLTGNFIKLIQSKANE